MSAPDQAPLSESELCPPALLAEQEAAFARDVERLIGRAAQFRPVPCPACGADEPRPGLHKWGFAWPRCGTCGTLYMSPRPPAEVMAGYYADSENYRIWAERIFPASEAARRDKVHRPRLERVLDICRRHGVAPGTLVEVGPGFGTFAALAQDTGAFGRVVVVEPTPELAAACRERGLQVVERRVEDAVGALPPADVVAAFEVVEHLIDPADLLRGLAALLAPGRLLVLSCPNAAGFDVATLGAASLAVDPEHVNLFTPASLGTLLGRFGFTVVEATTPGRLDAELVRDAALRGDLDLSGQPLLSRVLLEEFDRLGPPFQRFLAEQGLSSHMWVVARRG